MEIVINGPSDSHTWAINSMKAFGHSTITTSHARPFWTNNVPSSTSMACWATRKHYSRNEIFTTTTGAIAWPKIFLKVFCLLWIPFRCHGVCRYNAPQRLEWKNATKDETGQNKQSAKMNALSMFLMNTRTGTKVFQHFLFKSNLSHLIDGKIDDTKLSLVVA